MEYIALNAIISVILIVMFSFTLNYHSDKLINTLNLFIMLFENVPENDEYTRKTLFSLQYEINRHGDNLKIVRKCLLILLFWLPISSICLIFLSF